MRERERERETPYPSVAVLLPAVVRSVKDVVIARLHIKVNVMDGRSCVCVCVCDR